MTRRDKRRIADLEAREITHLSRIARLEKQLEAATGVPAAISVRREADMAGRVISLERALKRTQQQLDDALGRNRFDDLEIDKAGLKEAEPRAYQPGGAS